MRGAHEEAVEGEVLAEQGFLIRGGQPGDVHAVFHRQFHDQAGQGASHREDIAGHRGAGGAHLRSLESLGAEDVSKGADARDGTEVDQLHLILGDDDVVRLEVVVDHPAGVQIIQRGEDLQDITDGDIHVQRAVHLPPARAQGRPTHELHDDESTLGARIINKVEDLHDSRVGDLRQEGSLGFRNRPLVRAVRGHHALEHHVAIRHEVIHRQVHPAHATVGDGTQHLVLVRENIPRLQRGGFHTALDGFRRIHDGRLGLRGSHKRQLDHATGYGRSGSVDTAALAERGESLAPGFLTRVNLHRVGVFGIEPVVIIVIIGEGIEGHGGGGRLGLRGILVDLRVGDLGILVPLGQVG